ncbi:MAG: hypothetical protein WC521_06860 [Bdellovibrionales bacterium]|jgi:opacity protein-like surface antigen
MKSLKALSLCSTALLLAACAAAPTGPGVRALPPQGKNFEKFAEEQAYCKQYANDQVQGQAERANSTGLVQGLGATALGAGLGAAINGGQGAAVGAAMGATAGTVVGAGTSSNKHKSIQQQYDDAYVQCMVAKGNLIPAPAVPHQTVIYQSAPPPTVIVTQPPPPPTVIYTQPVPPRHYHGHY